MDLQKIIPSLATSKPLQVFKKVVAFNEAKADNAKRATVRLGLSTGFILEGIPLKMDKEGNAVFTSVHQSISYVNTQQIVGLEILNPEVLLEVLTGGSYFEVPKDGIPTNLDLKRGLKAASEKAQNSYGFLIESDLLDNGLTTDAEKFQFRQFLDHFKLTIEAIAQDDIGKEAMNDLKSISITSSENDISGSKDNGNLKLSVNFKSKFTSGFQNKLRETLELNL